MASLKDLDSRFVRRSLKRELRKETLRALEDDEAESEKEISDLLAEAEGDLFGVKLLAEEPYEYSADDVLSWYDEPYEAELHGSYNDYFFPKEAY